MRTSTVLFTRMSAVFFSIAGLLIAEATATPDPASFSKESLRYEIAASFNDAACRELLRFVNGEPGDYQKINPTHIIESPSIGIEKEFHYILDYDNNKTMDLVILPLYNPGRGAGQLSSIVLYKNKMIASRNKHGHFNKHDLTINTEHIGIPANLNLKGTYNETINRHEILFSSPIIDLINEKSNIYFIIKNPDKSARIDKETSSEYAFAYSMAFKIIEPNKMQDVCYFIAQH